jgi:hypothetical protein
MRMVLIVNLRCSRFSCFCPEFKKWCHGDRSHASLALVARRWPVVASAMEVSGAGGALQGTTVVDVTDVEPWLGDSTESLLHDLVVRGAGAGIPGSAAPSDAVPAPRSSSAVSLVVSGMYLPGSPSYLPHLSTGGGWRIRQSLHVRRSLSRRGCCMRR